MRRIIYLLLFCLLSYTVDSQVITRNINNTFISTDTIYPFTVNDYCFGMSLVGNSRLLTEDGFIRVILVDDNNNEWLMYERNNLYSTDEEDNFHNASFETFMLDSVCPTSVIIQSEHASLQVVKIKINKTPLPDRASFQENFNSLFIQKNIQLVNRINDTLSLYKKAWRADTTFLSNKRYQYKKEFFPEGMPNLEGWDYYAYGYYSPLGDNTPQASNDIVKEFDWRTRHGANIPGLYYYNSDGSGWIPKRRYCQVQNECWAFSVAYAVESMVNLYFNKQYNDELSVQDILSCSNGGTWYGGGLSHKALNYVQNVGIVDEQCFPFRPYQTVSCEEKCDEPMEVVNIAEFSSTINGENNIKQSLITKGTLVTTVRKWGHGMCMVGFGVVKAGDMILNGNYQDTIELCVDPDSPDIGKPYYIFKQSNSLYGPDKTPFCNVIIDANNHNYMYCYAIDTPINSLQYNDYGVECVDIDGDGYYNWGIGPKPENCPECPDEIDSDDSSALLGPYNDKFESVILCDNYVYKTIPEDITTSKVWCSKRNIDHDIIIDAGCTLTVMDTIYLGENTKIIIQPGGKLLLDENSLLTSLCNNQWQGIEVWGNDSIPQYPYDGVYSQGFLELKNGATIENAVCAVELWNPLDNHSEGGIVHATDAIFRNNAKAIHALNYTNYDPETNFEVDYNSSFNNCSFVVDSNYMGEELFQRHIDLSNVSGFNFHGCSFSVDKSVPQVSPRPYGIVANNTGLNLSYYIPEGELPLPGGNFTRNSFEGFETGIYVTNSSQYSRTVSVEYSDFSNNAKGLLVQNTGYATINNNNFIIGYDADCSFGLYLDRVSYFDVEENTFIGNANYGSDNYGVMVRSSASYNDISRNTFRNLQCGNVSLGKNYVTGSRVGLTYTCNTNIGNVNDFCIFKEDGIGGISSCQGSLVDPAGNTFSGSNYHICNDGDNTISYYYQANNNLQRPVASKLYNVRAVGSSNISSCGIGNNPGIDIMSIDDVVTLENAYNTTLAAYNALLQTNSQSVETAEDIEAQLSQLKTEYLNTVGEIVKFYLQQEEKDYEELREWLVKSEDIFADRMVVASFIQEGNYDDAMTYATMLPKIHNLKGEELQDHNDYMKLIDLYIDLHEADRTANQLTDAELMMVKNISDNGIGTSQMMAESILLAIGEPSLRVPQCLTMPPALIIFPQTRGAEQEIMELAEDEESHISIYPNPANDNITIELSSDCHTIEIYDSFGRMMMGQQVTESLSHQVVDVDISKYPSGLYLVVVKDDNNRYYKRIVKN